MFESIFSTYYVVIKQVIDSFRKISLLKLSMKCLFSCYIMGQNKIAPTCLESNLFLQVLNHSYIYIYILNFISSTEISFTHFGIQFETNIILIESTKGFFFFLGVCVCVREREREREREKEQGGCLTNILVSQLSSPNKNS